VERVCVTLGSRLDRQVIQVHKKTLESSICDPNNGLVTQKQCVSE
jgi:hypothetical protein